jgi:septal ring factor EnvC (AmiA/AmiB activator)
MSFLGIQIPIGDIVALVTCVALVVGAIYNSRKTSADAVAAYSDAATNELKNRQALQEQIDKLRDRLDVKDKTIDELLNGLGERDKRISALETRISDLGVLNTRKDTRINELEALTVRQQNEIDTLRDEVHGLRQSNTQNGL